VSGFSRTFVVSFPDFMPSQIWRTKSLDVLVSEADVPQHQLNIFGVPIVFNG
jgi:hypothetical protein